MMDNGSQGHRGRRVLGLVLALGAAATACGTGGQPTPVIAASGSASVIAEAPTPVATESARPSPVISPNSATGLDGQTPAATVSTPSPVTTSIGSVLWWNGFHITLDKATFTPDPGTTPSGGRTSGALRIVGSAENLSDQQRRFAGDSDQPTVTVGGRSFQLQSPAFDNVASRGTMTLDLEFRLDEPFDPAGAMLIFGSTDELQSTAVLMSGGAVQTVEPRSLQAGAKASTPVLALAVTGGTADASYRMMEKGRYEVRVAVDATYLGHASGGYYLAATQFTLTGADSAVAAPREADDLSALPVPAGSLPVHTYVSFLLPHPPGPTLTISYDGREGNGVTGTAELKVSVS